jgi:glycosyltransferase involved in cell wall biosynthesis
MSKAIALPGSEHLEVPKRRIKVGLVSCGLGRVHRGFEVSTSRLFRAICQLPDLEVKLFTGGNFDGSTPVINLPRDFLLNTILRPATMINERRVWELAYGIEQISFAMGLMGELLAWQPDVIWTKEAPFAHILWTTRGLLRLNFKIVFANGGGFKPSTYAMFDHIQHLHLHSYERAVAAGMSPSKMRVLPNVLPPIETSLSRLKARASFGYTADDWVIICVAAWNRHHKRIDYLIEEVASLKDHTVKLLLCGHPEPDTKSLKSLARRKLGDRVQWHTLPESEIPRALKAADVFVLPSLNELFGSASIEAAMAGVPVVAHPHGSSSMLIDHGFQATDLSKSGNLAKKLRQIRRRPPDPQELKRLAEAICNRFSETSLATRFGEMIHSIV